jgi:hypothetical protein
MYPGCPISSYRFNSSNPIEACPLPFTSFNFVSSLLHELESIKIAFLSAKSFMNKISDYRAIHRLTFARFLVQFQVSNNWPMSITVQIGITEGKTATSLIHTASNTHT